MHPPDLVYYPDTLVKHLVSFLQSFFPPSSFHLLVRLSFCSASTARCMPLSFSLSLCVPLFFSLSLSHCIPLSFSLPLYHSVPLSLHLSLMASLSLSTASLFFCTSLSLSHQSLFFHHPSLSQYCSHKIFYTPHQTRSNT